MRPVKSFLSRLELDERHLEALDRAVRHCERRPSDTLCSTHPVNGGSVDMILTCGEVLPLLRQKLEAARRRSERVEVALDAAMSMLEGVE